MKKNIVFCKKPLFLWLQRAYMNTDGRGEMLQLRSSLAQGAAANQSPPASVQPSMQTHKCHDGPNNHSASHFLLKLLFSAHSSPTPFQWKHVLPILLQETDAPCADIAGSVLSSPPPHFVLLPNLKSGISSEVFIPSAGI